MLELLVKMIDYINLSIDTRLHQDQLARPRHFIYLEEQTVVWLIIEKEKEITCGTIFLCVRGII